MNNSISNQEVQQKEVAVLGIDFQNDFMENGNLAVPNSFHDVHNFSSFLSLQKEKYTDIYMSLDTHVKKQIFHPCWWADKNGFHPEPFTVISYQSVLDGIWKPLYMENESIAYLKGLSTEQKRELIIWSYHCIQGSEGVKVEPQLQALLHDLSGEGKNIHYVEKGLNPISEMYGIIKPEFSTEDLTNYSLINELRSYKKIIIGGEAKSHCVLESIKQLVQGFEQINHTAYTLYILEDCMSSISGFEEGTEDEYARLAENTHVIRTTSKDLFESK